MQSRRGKVGQQFLKTSVSLGGFERLTGRFDGVKCACLLNEQIGAPIIPLLIVMIIKAVPRRGQRQHAPAEITFARHLRGQMARDALDVFHQQNRFLENIVVDALENVADPRAGLVKDDAISVVDVAAAVRFRLTNPP